MNPSDVSLSWFYLATFLAGGVVGLSEIVSRYKDAPMNAATTWPGILYCLLNAGGSAAALALMLQMGWFKDLATGPVSNLIMQSILAATGTMAIFRSSLFTVRVGNADVSIGPAAFLQILMTATDRAVDRARAQPRAAAVQRIMTDIDFQKAKQALPTLCFGLMQNVSIQEQDTFGTIVAKLDSADMDDVFKTNNLGLALMNLVGEDVLSQAVGMLREDIAEIPQPIVQSLETLGLLRNLTFEASGRQLVEGCIFLANKSGDGKTNAGIDAEHGRIGAMTVSDRQKILLLSAALIGRFGEPLLKLALRALPENDPPRSLIPSPGPGAGDPRPGRSRDSGACHRCMPHPRQPRAGRRAPAATGHRGGADRVAAGIGHPAAPVPGQCPDRPLRRGNRSAERWRVLGVEADRGVRNVAPPVTFPGCS